MAITNATRVADFGSGIGTEGAVLQVDNSNNRLGVGTTNPQAMLQVGTAVSVYGNSGIVSATSFYGDGANLTGLATTDVIVSDQILVLGVTTVGSAVTINSTGIDAVSGVITAANFVGGGANLTALSASNLGSGTVPDARFPATLPAISGANLTNLSGTAIASGTVAAARVATLNQNTSGTAGGLTGTPDITINNLTGVAATFTGVLTYEDVTNVDSTGIVTARGGVKVGSLTGTGVTIGVDNSGDAIFAGIVTAGTCFKAGSVSGGAFGAGVGVTITGDGNIDATGIVTATKFVGLRS